MSSLTLMEFHERLSHLHFDTCKNTVRTGKAKGLTVDIPEETPVCKSHIHGKLTRAQVVCTHAGEHSKSISDLVLADVLGPSKVVSGQGYRYYVLFLDSHTRMAFIFY